MKNIYLWEKILLVIIAVLSFIAGFSISIIDAVMALVINVLILYCVFRVCNAFFNKIKKTRDIKKI